MPNHNIVFFDDDEDFSKIFNSMMDKSNFNIISYKDYRELKKALNDDNIISNTKIFIFDLAKDNDEEKQTEKFSILKDIEEKYNNLRIPIFIHSAFANEFPLFKNKGTVWKIEKSDKSLEQIAEIIFKLEKSGYLEVFCHNGIIEKSVMAELHKSFTDQFRNGEIERIIDSIASDDAEQFKNRSINIFKRIAIKSLMSELLSPISFENETVNAIEHYYRRQNKIDYWTGDIYSKSDNTDAIVILTPRCDLANNKATNLLVCSIDNDFPKDNKKEKIKKAITDNPNFTSNICRYLPPSPTFNGGKVNFKTFRTISNSVLNQEYKYEITLSDDLSNEILSKISSYLLRTGISTIDLNELINYIDSLNEPN